VPQTAYVAAPRRLFLQTTKPNASKLHPSSAKSHGSSKFLHSINAAHTITGYLATTQATHAAATTILYRGAQAAASKTAIGPSTDQSN